MRLRRDILPKCLRDAFVTCFLLLLVPTVHLYHLYVVIPAFHQVWSTAYNIHFFLSNFLGFNVYSNLIATVLTDTSIKCLSHSDPNWRYCTVCKVNAPPRSWHCRICNICIMKRDHHCIFTSCCIGLGNLRYYLVFLTYLILCEIYVLIYSFYFLKEFVLDLSLDSLLKCTFPLYYIVVHFNKNNFYIFLTNLVFSGMVGNIILLQFQIDLMLKSLVTYERKEVSKYDRGKLKNTESVLGERWYLVWIAPWIESKIPNDGVNWDYQGVFKIT